MISAPRLLEYYVRGILQMSGARAASIFIPAGRTASSAPMLIHAGDGPPLPEFSSPEEAAKIEEGGLDSGAASPDGPRLAGSRDPDGLILALPPIAVLTAGSREDEVPPPGRRRLDVASAAEGPRAGWLGLRLPPGPSSPFERLRASVTPAGPADSSATFWWNWILFLGGGLAEHAAEVSAMLRDPVSGLPGRSAFHVLLDQEVDSARSRRQPLGLVSVNPDGFAPINERFGREAADEAIRELVVRIQSVLRASDIVTRFGGVTFMIIVPGASLAEAAAVAEKIRAAVREAPFLEGTLRLVASAGVTAFEPGRIEIATPADLVRRSDQALNTAKRAGGDRVAAWEPGSESARAESFDRLSGIFTGRMSIDYRNMGLLWDAMNVMARFEDVESLAPQIVERIDRAFSPRSTALFVRDERGEPRLAYGLVRSDEHGNLLEVVESLELPPEESALIRKSQESGRSAEIRIRATDRPGDDALLHVVATPLSSHDRSMGALLLKSVRPFELADVTFLAGLGRQVGAALERIQLAADLKRSGRLLEAEVQKRTKELAVRNDELGGAIQKLEESSLTDSLTGLHNRRFMMTEIDKEIGLVDRYYAESSQPGGSDASVPRPDFVLLMVDLDGFKPVNDSRGHAAGDRVLLQIKDVLERACRRSDTILRWGGDEFLIIGRFAQPAVAETLAERIRSLVAEHSFDLGDGHAVRLSCSIGFAFFPFIPAAPRGVTWEQVVMIADRALYVAKSSGKNAWVGIFSTRKTPPGNIAPLINSRLEVFVLDGSIELHTSLTEPAQLVLGRA